ncbi:MAG: hypothetical protein DWQ07_21155 [Chloroflexi bacterium]|nr:MAG: hypothetical protein DWQ07_21155 [Chloroflexota bacterium]MBL1194592.1 hypothetical protein [Chloroflexota bacterium]NOH11881.1 hypothetical protein [Chloroflexota bacterium]
MTANPVRFLHISDTHIGPSRDFEIYGSHTYDCVSRLVDTINNLPIEPDFIIHTGDVVTDPFPEAYTLSAEIFSKLKAPIYYASGNHDLSSMLIPALPMGPKEDLLVDEGVNCYRFEVGSHRFLVLDGRGPDEIDANGQLAEAQYQILEDEIAADGPLSIFIHFPALELDTVWLDRDMLLLEGERFHKLVQQAKNLRGVFLGHIHRGGAQYRDGVLYSSVASPIGQFSMWPEDQQGAAAADSGCTLYYNLVTLTDDTTIIKEFVSS